LWPIAENLPRDLICSAVQCCSEHWFPNWSFQQLSHRFNAFLSLIFYTIVEISIVSKPTCLPRFIIPCMTVFLRFKRCAWLLPSCGTSSISFRLPRELPPLVVRVLQKEQAVQKESQKFNGVHRPLLDQHCWLLKIKFTQNPLLQFYHFFKYCRYCWGSNRNQSQKLARTQSLSKKCYLVVEDVCLRLFSWFRAHVLVTTPSSLLPKLWRLWALDAEEHLL